MISLFHTVVLATVVVSAPILSVTSITTAVAHAQESNAWHKVFSTTGTLLGERIAVGMRSAPFPHPKRLEGHIYNGTTYTAHKHYTDSSVAVFLRQGFRPSKALDIVVYLHGWLNSIDSANAQFRLMEQFAESNRNALLILPEGPLFAPDSFAGKLEDSCGLQRLLQETLELLHRTKNIKATIGNVILAGHSGAYRGIAYMLLRGNIPVREVWLFDGQYGHTEKFTHWLEHDRKRLKGRFINIYTNDGGTKTETEKLMEDLAAWGIRFQEVQEIMLTEQDLARHHVLFIHSDLSHNEVIAKRNQFRRFLATSCLRSK